MASVNDYAEYITEAQEALNDIQGMCLHGVVDDSKLTYAHIAEEVEYLIKRLRLLQSWAVEKKNACKSR